MSSDILEQDNNYIFYAHNFNKNSGGSSLFYMLCVHLKNNNYNNFFIAPLFCRGDGLIDKGYITHYNLNESSFDFDKHGRSIYPIENLSDSYYNKETYNWPDEYKQFLITREILEKKNNIAIYSEGIVGNPLQQKYCIRWILYFPTPGLPVDPYFSWGKNDFFLFWCKSYFKNKDTFYRALNNTNEIVSTDYYPSDTEILYLKYLFLHKNCVFDSPPLNTFEREGSCYLIRKADINYNRTFGKNWNDGNQYNSNHPFMKPKPPIFIHPNDSVCIDSYGIDDLITIFQKTTYFYCYDLFTFHNCIALLYGCKVIMCIPQGELTKEDWHCGEECYLDYVAWGDSKEELDKAEKALTNVNYIQIINKLQSEFLDNFKDVYTKLENHFNNLKNTFCFKKIENLECDGNNFETINNVDLYNNKEYTKKYSSNFWEIDIDFIIDSNNCSSNLFDCNYNNINYGPRLEYNDNNLSLILGNNSYHNTIIISNDVNKNIQHTLKIKLESNMLTITFNDNISNYIVHITPNRFENIVIGKGFNEKHYFKGIINKFCLTVY